VLRSYGDGNFAHITPNERADRIERSA